MGFDKSGYTKIKLLDLAEVVWTDARRTWLSTRLVEHTFRPADIAGRTQDYGSRDSWHCNIIMQNMQGFKRSNGPQATLSPHPWAECRSCGTWGSGPLARSCHALAEAGATQWAKIFFLTRSLRSPLAQDHDGSWALNRNVRFAPLDNLLEHTPTF
jgi:hypothetical protein